jgi:hypothetical protein
VQKGGVDDEIIDSERFAVSSSATRLDLPRCGIFVIRQEFSTFTCPDLCLANEKHAALNLEKATLEHDLDVVGLAVFGIVSLTRPFVRTLRSEAHEHLDADDRPVSLVGIDVVRVGFGLAGLRIVGFLQRYYGGTQCAATVTHTYDRIVIFGIPGTSWIQGEARKRRRGQQSDGQQPEA